MRKKENIGLLYIYGYFSVVVGNLLIDSHELITHHNHGENNVDHFTNIWYFYTTDDSNGTHEAIIQQGFSYAKPVDGLPNVYKVTSDVHPEVHVDPAHHMTDLLKQHDKVRWAVQGFTRNLYKRVPMDVRSRYERYFNDELWDLQWYEQDYRDNNDDDAPILDMNLVPVYEELKITGHNIRVAIVDDGLEYTHDDLKNNYAPEISINLNWNTKDPMPRYEDPSNTHGTRCAGEIAMAANNKICGVGVAYNSKVGGIVLLDGKTDDELEARALTYAYDLVDIYGGSWGPKDDGKTVDGPGVLGQMAFDKGATQGRDGKGSIYVFASGNGRTVFDNCAVDGYVGSIYTVAISSATIQGKAPAYAERCPGVMATAYSGGIDNQVKVVTTDVNNKCTLSHTGTSAAAPLAAGVIALALEANGNLTWRDVQHLLARNCEVTPLSTDPGWTTNAAGFYFNPQFGFGLLNAYRLVKESIDWQTVPKKSICSVEFDLTKTNRYFGRAAEFRSTVITDGCDNSVLYLEHVQLSITIQYPKRGAVEVDLISPQNTVCKMLEPRRWDESSEGFVGWKIKSLQFWGENPVGQWTAIVRDTTSGLYAGFTGSVENLKLILHGTQIPPYDN